MNPVTQPTSAFGAAAGKAASAPASAAAASSATSAARVARVVVLGAGGYSGQEFARLALAHPGLSLTALVSRDRAGEPADRLIPGLDPRLADLPAVVDVAAAEALFESGAADTLVACLPHGAWRTLAGERPRLALAPRLVVDLSADHRDDSASVTGGVPYCYGLPEAFRSEIPGATRIANPGCYPTATALALLPAAEAGWIAGPVMVSALSGVSGAGRAATLRTSFVELDGGASLYKAGVEHPHVAEMERTLARLAASGAGAPKPDPALPGAMVGFAPQLVPMARGILLTASAPLSRELSPAECHAHYTSRYAHEPFVRVLAQGVWPETRAVRGSNRCDVAVTTLHGGRTLFAASAIDNLVKGAAGQAIQNLNLLLGWPEATGLAQSGQPW